MGKLQDRVAIVTGGGRGIGRGIVDRFAEEGAKVLIATRTASAGEEAADAIKAKGGDAIVLGLDIGALDEPKRAVEAAVSRWGRLDIIVHNAAYIPYEPLAGMSDEAFTRAFETNVGAGFRFLKHGLPYLEKSGHGRLIFTSSTAATSTVPQGLAAYAMSKAGMEGFLRGAAVELASRGITVNAVAPGATLTEAMERTMSPESIDKMSRKMPLGRIGAPADIASAMLYLASNEGAYVTGHVLRVDGGQMLTQDFEMDQGGPEA